MLKIESKNNLQPKQYLSNKFRDITLNRNPKIYRPSSEPFISGDTLRKKSTHIFDETKTLNPRKVNKNDIVFIKTELKDIYFKNYHSKIEAPYILICHNSDDNFDEESKLNLDEKIIHCFAQNLNIDSSKQISPLPIGFENRRYRSNGKVSNLQNALQLNYKKKDKIFCSFNKNTNYQKRNEILNQIKSKENFVFKTFDNNFEYLKELSKYKFSLCPPGNGLDTHRVWESLLVGTIPIVEDNVLNNNFIKMGVPLLLFRTIDEIEQNISNSTHIDTNNSIKFSQIEYWWNIIQGKKII